MPIAFRCEQCDQLMSISRRRAGQMTTCPRCQASTRVPSLESQTEPQTESLTQPADDSPPQRSVPPTPPHVPAASAEKDPVIAPTKRAPLHRPSLGWSQGHQDDEDDEPEFVLNAGRPEVEEMDLTPMVDVTFLLLIFFMITASFSIQKSLQVPPPDPENEGAAQTIQPLDNLEENSILVDIDANNRYFVEDDPVPDPRDLTTVLAQIRSRDGKNELLVTADSQTLHEAVVTAIDAGQEVGLQRIRWAIRNDD